MRLIRTGCTRLVLELKTVVVKFPNFTYSWEHFIHGILANIRESRGWRYSKHNKKIRALICPVLFTSWLSLILVMKRVKVLSDEEYLKADISKHQEFFPGDDKSDSYGLLDGRVVKIDYGS